MPSRQVKRWPLTISFPARHFHDDEEEEMQPTSTGPQSDSFVFQNATWCVTDADINIRLPFLLSTLASCRVHCFIESQSLAISGRISQTRISCEYYY